jgi:plastocyanin
MLRRRVFAMALAAIGSIALFPATAGAGGGCTEVTSGKSGAVDLKDFCVFPTLVRVPVGTVVRFTNYDPVDHVIVGSGMAWGSDGTMGQGDSFSATFERDGVYPFQCYLHPGMVGAVLVGDANGKGAATSSGVTVGPPGDAAATSDGEGAGSAETSGDAPARSDSGAGTSWWPMPLAGMLAGAVVAAALALAVLRTRRAAARRPAAT